MAKTVYVDGNNGDNSNDGLSWVNAKKTIAGARAATASGDLVLIAPGVYPETVIAFTASTDHNVLYRRDPTKAGKVIVDFENLNPGSSAYWQLTWNYGTHFMDMHFRNMYAGVAAFWCIDFTLSSIVHCVFYQRDGAANTGVGIRNYNSGGNRLRVQNCTFYNLQYGLYDFTGIGGIYGIFGNYFVNCTTPMFSMAGVVDYNAYPGNAEANGINTSVTDVGLTDPANEDFTLDTTDGDWGTFMSSGFQGGSIGAWGNGGILYDNILPQLAFFSADQAPTTGQGNPQPGWENEGPNGTNTYTAGTPTDIIINPATGEPELDLATVPAATGGRMRSDVFDIGAGTTIIRAFSFSGFEDKPVGAMFDIDTTLPQQEEYRSSATSFLKGDGSPSWTAYARGDNINVTGHRYMQLRMELRTDHTNS